MKILKLAGIVGVLSLAFTTGAQTTDKAKLDLFFDRLAEKEKAMGSIVLVKGGKLEYARNIGYREINGAEKKPVGEGTRFRIGSITKTFTATIVLQLAEEGKLKLTDPLDKFLPQVPNAKKITIGQILAHRSGIPNIGREQNGQDNIKTLPMSKEEHLALIIKASPDFEPGTRSLYSNSGYFVLGLIIEQVTGTSYAAVLQSKIVDKIGLKDTYLATGNIDVDRNEAQTYFKFPGSGWVQSPETHPSLLFSAGAIISTPKDLASFIQALFDGKLISKESLGKMTMQQDNEGFGMVTFPFAGKTFYGHTGGADNYGAWVAYLPEEKLAMAYATNAKIYPVKDIVNGVMDIYYHQPFEIPSFESVAVPTELLDKYAGVYVLTGAPPRFTFTRGGDTLFVTAPGEQKPVPLEATSQKSFKIDNGTPTGIVFEFDTANKTMKIKRGEMERVFTKQD